MKPITAAVLILVLSANAPPVQPAARPPARIGTCAFTTIGSIGQRLEDGAGKDIPNSGSRVELRNGVYGVSYDQVDTVLRSKIGDRVMTCLVRIPMHCPPGDTRGRWYTTTNLRTNESWTLPDAQHMCGGA